MGNVPPPPGSSWPPEPPGPGGPQHTPHPQQDQTWAWPPGAAPGTPPGRHPAAGPDSAVWAWPPPPRPARERRFAPAEPPAGAAYHRLARTARFRWWMPPAAVAVFALLYFFVWLGIGLVSIIVAVAGGFGLADDDTLIFGATVPDLALMLIIIIPMAPVAVFVVRLVEWRRIGTLFSVEGRLRWRWMLLCTAVSFIPLAVSFGLMFALIQAVEPGAAFIGPFAGGADFLPALLVILLLVPFQASAEEIALRGFLMQAVGGYGAARGERRGNSVVSAFLRTPVLAIAVSGLVFTLMHTYTDWATVDVAVFGLAMAWLTWYTGGLEAAIALHVVHNLVAFTLTAYEGQLDQAGTGGGSLVGVLATLLQVTLYCVIVVWLAKRRGLRTRTPAEAARNGGPPSASGTVGHPSAGPAVYPPAPGAAGPGHPPAHGPTGPTGPTGSPDAAPPHREAEGTGTGPAWQQPPDRPSGYGRPWFPPPA